MGEVWCSVGRSGRNWWSMLGRRLGRGTPLPLMSSHCSHADCFFVQKAYYGQLAGAQAVLVTDHTEVSSQPFPRCCFVASPVCRWLARVLHAGLWRKQHGGELTSRCTWAAVLGSAGMAYHHVAAAPKLRQARVAPIVQEGLLTMAIPEDRPEVAALVPKISIPVVLVTKARLLSGLVYEYM